MKKRLYAAILAVVSVMTLTVSALAYGEHWLDTVADPPEYAYSFAVVGDTQVVCERSPEGFKTIYDWILQNLTAKKTKMVIGLGDITENKTDIDEWALAEEQIMRLHGKVPLSLVRGNHDDEGSFNNTFYDLYDDVDGSYEKGSLNNSYQLLTVGDLHYLILALDYGPSDDVLKWAGKVCKQYPGYNVIVTTHGYMDTTGTLLKKGKAGVNDGGMAYHGAENGGEEIWKQLVSQHKNIVMVLCGHIGENGVVRHVRVGKGGNPVLELLINPQNIDDQHKLTGMVAMLYFSKDGKTVTVQNYSTIEKKFYGQPFTASVQTVAHTHAAVDTAWQHDKEAHWQLCPCGEPVAKLAHEFSDGTCVCGEQTVTTATTATTVSTTKKSSSTTKAGTSRSTAASSTTTTATTAVKSRSTAASTQAANANTSAVGSTLSSTEQITTVSDNISTTTTDGTTAETEAQATTEEPAAPSLVLPIVLAIAGVLVISGMAIVIVRLLRK